MKRKISLIIAAIISMLLLMTQSSFAQCDSKTIRNNVIISLDDYTYESFAYKAFKECENKKIVKATFDVFRNEDYRVVDVSEGFEGKVIINIYDSKNKLFMSNVYMQTADVFDFKAKYSGEYMIEYIFDKKDYNKPENKCIACGLGYK